MEKTKKLRITALAVALLIGAVTAGYFIGREADSPAPATMSLSETGGMTVGESDGQVSLTSTMIPERSYSSAQVPPDAEGAFGLDLSMEFPEELYQKQTFPFTFEWFVLPNENWVSPSGMTWEEADQDRIMGLSQTALHVAASDATGQHATLFCLVPFDWQMLVGVRPQNIDNAPVWASAPVDYIQKIESFELTIQSDFYMDEYSDTPLDTRSITLSEDTEEFSIHLFDLFQRGSSYGGYFETIEDWFKAVDAGSRFDDPSLGYVHTEYHSTIKFTYPQDQKYLLFTVPITTVTFTGWVPTEQWDIKSYYGIDFPTSEKELFEMAERNGKPVASFDFDGAKAMSFEGEETHTQEIYGIDGPALTMFDYVDRSQLRPSSVNTLFDLGGGGTPLNLKITFSSRYSAFAHHETTLSVLF